MDRKTELACDEFGAAIKAREARGGRAAETFDALLGLVPGAIKFALVVVAVKLIFFT